MDTRISKRAQLMKLTQEANAMLQNGFNGSHNLAILELYRKQGFGQTFKTLEGWNRCGYMVQKGQSSLTLWTKKQGNINRRELIHIFSEQQVFRINSSSKKQPQKHNITAANIHIKL